MRCNSFFKRFLTGVHNIFFFADLKIRSKNCRKIHLISNL
ncbi:hypothetical protein MuYL_2073 [Mucilaginibacter xinganensis]|uniref:Uncharacterized protein n=1 Tax=Mucilaginibacter xinganensis TaxID=1234841 RepID=A0A223NVQ6_9SPHI|nr:hypothetical protein MuYL_2073 [Mucilaginibacter xinganensis]